MRRAPKREHSAFPRREGPGHKRRVGDRWPRAVDAHLPPRRPAEPTAAAGAMLATRANDGRYGSFTFVAGSGLGADHWGHRPSAWVARVRPFVVTSQSQFRTERQ